MKVKRNDRRSAAYDNQISIFLTQFCEEMLGESISLSDLYNFYIRIHSQCVSKHDTLGTKIMSQPSFFKRIQAAGI